MRTFATLITSAAITFGLGSVALLSAPESTPAPVTPVASSKSLSAVSVGVCERHDGERTIVVCVPAATPDGDPLVNFWEDGSARYADGTVFDPETLNFR